MSKTKNNRTYKDSVFVDLFSEDKNAKANFLSLYNALHGTNLDMTTDLQPLRLEQVMYMNFCNDVSCLIDNKIIVLAEHQSTVNENMPIRFLEYVARLYEQIQEPRDRYLRKLKKIPTPEFFVFYNGKENFPAAKTLKLSDAFMSGKAKVNLELIVEVININTSKKNKIVENCKPLAEYSLFVESVRKHTEEDRENGFKNAIKECMHNDILKEYLQRKSKEVMNMLVCEYNYAEDIATQREEERQIAFAQGIERGLEQGIQQGIERGIERGLEQGIQQGIERGIERGLEQGIQQGIERGIERGFSDGSYQAKLETAIAFKKMGVPIEIIVKGTGLSQADIEKL